MTASEGHAPRRFGRFELQPQERARPCRRSADGGGGAARAFDLLVALVERAGQLVAKNELLERVWAGPRRRGKQPAGASCRRCASCWDRMPSPRFRGRGYRLRASDRRRPGFRQRQAARGTATPQPLATQARRTPCGHAPTFRRIFRPSMGRDQDLQQVKALLRNHIVVTIAGAGGDRQDAPSRRPRRGGHCRRSCGRLPGWRGWWGRAGRTQ